MTRLTPREIAVVELLARGYSNKAIALALCVELGTVKDHVSHLLFKLGASSRLEVVLLAHMAGHVDLVAEAERCADRLGRIAA